MKMKKQTPLVTVPSRFSLRKHVFYGILALVSLLGLGMTQSARANIVTLEQVGANVVASGSGAINFAGLALSGFLPPTLAQINPSGGKILTGLQSEFLQTSTHGIDNGPTSFGGGGLLNASSGSGYLVGIDGALDQIFIPGGATTGKICRTPRLGTTRPSPASA